MWCAASLLNAITHSRYVVYVVAAQLSVSFYRFTCGAKSMRLLYVDVDVDVDIDLNYVVSTPYYDWCC